MGIEIYVDILFLINFFMVYFIFWVVNKLIKNKVRLLRLFFGASLSSFFYLITIVFVPFKKSVSIFLVTLIMFFSVLIAFKPSTTKDFFKTLILVYLVSFFIGGASISIFYYTNFLFFLEEIFKPSQHKFPIKILLVSILLAYIVIKIGLVWYNRILLKKQSFYNIILSKNGEKVTVNALLDTGNSLREPISKKPVVVVEFLALEKILTNSLREVFIKNEEDYIEKLIENGIENNIRFIPFKSVGKDNGLMIGIQVEQMEIQDENIILKDVIVAIANLKLSKDGFYRALLNPEMLNK